MKKFVKINGWEILVMTTMQSIGKVVNYRMEYGNSPIRDRNSRNEQLAEFREQGIEYEIKPIYESRY